MSLQKLGARTLVRAPSSQPSNDRPTTANREPDWLARRYLKILAESEHTISFEPDDLDGLDDLEFEPDTKQPMKSDLRPDRAALAVLVARAIEKEPGLAAKLRKGSPVITLATHMPEDIPMIGHVIKTCVFPANTVYDSWQRPTPGTPVVHLIIRDGTDQASHKMASANAEVAKAIQLHQVVFGVAPRPRKHLPTDMVRASDHDISLPAFDASAMQLVCEAIFGASPTLGIEDAVIRSVDLRDLQFAFRNATTGEEAIAALVNVVARKRKTADGPRLSELAGYGAANVWGIELARDLSDLKAGRITWEDVDHKGVLLSGPPGVGKSQFAKALSAEADVPLVATSVAEWNAATYLSGTLQAIRKSFSKARQIAPCILFIDELDGIGDRASLRGEYVDYWTQIVNCVLEEMAGVTDRDGVIIVGATNHPGKIDAAIRRAGRLDREIMIGKPDVEALEGILRYHLGKSLPHVDLKGIALSARGATGADIEAAVRRARGAARRARRELTLEDIEVAIRFGKPPIPPEYIPLIVIHEAGHAVAAFRLGSAKVDAISIHSDGGTTHIQMDADRCANLAVLEDIIVMLLAGRAAEEVIRGPETVSVGSREDVRQATAFAVQIETSYGLGDLGLINLEGDEMRSPIWIPEVREAVQRRLGRLYDEAVKLIGENRASVEAVAEAFKARSYLTGNEIREIIARVDGGDVQVKPSRELREGSGDRSL